MSPALVTDPLTARLAERLRALRLSRGLSLDALAGDSGVSRATLSRIETGETSPTAEVLGRLAAAHGLPTSRLMQMAEDEAPALIPRAAQEVWEDAATGFRRRSVSPPAAGLAGHVVESTLAPHACVRYDRPPVAALEHHLVVLDGSLTHEADGATNTLGAGDCVRYRLTGASAFRAGAEGARYLVFVI